MKLVLLLIFSACLLNIGLIIAEAKKRISKDPCCLECGRIPNYGKKMIAKGQKVIPQNKYPWMVALTVKPSTEVICGGAILNRYFILTAAHCIETESEDVSPIIKNLRVGFLTKSQKPSKREKIEKVFIHPEYKKVPPVNDIALLKMKKPIRCNDFARPLCLPGKKKRIKTGAVFAITGWGSDDFNKDKSLETLNEARVVHVPPENCIEMEDYGEDKNIVLCMAGYDAGSPCYRDSGGPMFKSYGGRYFVFGVGSASYSHDGIHCDGTKVVLAYPHVQVFVPWIQNITGISPKKIP